MYIECHLCGRHCSKDGGHNHKQVKQETCSHGACIQMKRDREIKNQHNIRWRYVLCRELKENVLGGTFHFKLSSRKIFSK